MKTKMMLVMAAMAGSLFAVVPASATPVGAAAQSVKTVSTNDAVLEQVHYRRYRHNHRSYRNYGYRNYGYSYRPYSYYSSPYYYQPYYGYGYGRRYGGYGGYGHRRGGITFGFGF
jgi:hypothetical protein